jgi:hypothetical protein
MSGSFSGLFSPAEARQGGGASGVTNANSASLPKEVASISQPQQQPEVAQLSSPVMFSSIAKASAVAVEQACIQYYANGAAQILEQYFQRSFEPSVLSEKFESANVVYNFPIVDAKGNIIRVVEIGLVDDVDLEVVAPELKALVQDYSKELGLPYSVNVDGLMVFTAGHVIDKFVSENFSALHSEWTQNPSAGLYAYDIKIEGRETQTICSLEPISDAIISEAASLGLAVEPYSVQDALDSMGLQEVGVWWDQPTLDQARFITINGERILATGIDGSSIDPSISIAANPDPNAADSILAWQKKHLDQQLVGLRAQSTYSIDIIRDDSIDGIENTKVRITQKLNAPIKIGAGQVSEFSYDFDFGMADLTNVESAVSLQSELIAMLDSARSLQKDFLGAGYGKKGELLRDFLNMVSEGPVDVVLNMTHDGVDLTPPRLVPEPTLIAATPNQPAPDPTLITPTIITTPTNDLSQGNQPPGLETQESMPIDVSPSFQKLSYAQQFFETFQRSLRSVFFDVEGENSTICSKLSQRSQQVLRTFSNQLSSIIQDFDDLRRSFSETGMTPDEQHVSEFISQTVLKTERPRAEIRLALDELENQDQFKFQAKPKLQEALNWSKLGKIKPDQAGAVNELIAMQAEVEDYFKFFVE